MTDDDAPGTGRRAGPENVHSLDPLHLATALDALERDAAPLEPDAEARASLLRAVGSYAEQFLETLPDRKAYNAASTGEGLAEARVAEHGHPIGELLAIFGREVVDPGSSVASGTHLAYIPGGGIYHSALGDYLAAVTNKYSGIFFTGPGPVRMEHQMVRWAADLVGYPASAGGYIASGGSLANLSAITTARDAHGVKGANVGRAAVYLSEQAHHSVDKALRIAGLEDVHLRRLPVDDRFRMDRASLEGAIARDRAEGLHPWLIVASAGTTDTGAIDPLDAMADIAQREGCWLHVDAAYGGFFLLTAAGRKAMKGIERSDSVILDPHKGLFLPWGSGILVVRDVNALVRSNRYAGHYMQDAVRNTEELAPAEVSPELSRPFRALRMWLPLMALGVAPFRAALEEKLLLTRYFHREVQRLGFITGPEPELSISTFRWAPEWMSDAEADRFNERLVEAIRQDGRVFMSSTRIDGRFTIRMAALNNRTHRRDVELALRVLTDLVSTLSRQDATRQAGRPPELRRP